MNIFYLDHNPIVSAQLHCDRHVVKMINETVEMMCYNHRFLDGTKTKVRSRVYDYTLADEVMESSLLKIRRIHLYHPCTVWMRRSKSNYSFAYQLFIALCDEYKYRYNKVHAYDKMYRKLLVNSPMNIPNDGPTRVAYAFKKYPQYHLDDPVESYRLYYRTKLDKFKMKYTNRPTPDWLVPLTD